jgi:hypothetical protein
LINRQASDGIGARLQIILPESSGMRIPKLAADGTALKLPAAIDR